MWKEIAIMGYKVTVKVFEKGSQFGMDEAPRISKMAIFNKGKQVFNYDRGLDFNELPSWTYKIIIKAVKEFLL